MKVITVIRIIVSVFTNSALFNIEYQRPSGKI